MNYFINSFRFVWQIEVLPHGRTKYVTSIEKKYNKMPNTANLGQFPKSNSFQNSFGSLPTCLSRFSSILYLKSLLRPFQVPEEIENID